MSKTSEKIAKSPTPVARPNVDVPPGIKVERQSAGAVNSPNPAGGDVPPNRFTK